MTPRTYASPEVFKQALEQRLRSSAKTGGEFARKRQTCCARRLETVKCTMLALGYRAALGPAVPSSH
jgi:hypothetical protein